MSSKKKVLPTNLLLPPDKTKRPKRVESAPSNIPAQIIIHKTEITLLYQKDPLETPDQDSILDKLSTIENIFVVHTAEDLKFPKNQSPYNSIITNFKIMNSQGQHILSAGQASPCYCDKKLELYIFSPSGEPILKLIQRSPEQEIFTSDEMMSYLKVDQQLPPAVYYNETENERKYWMLDTTNRNQHNPVPHVHVEYVTTDPDPVTDESDLDHNFLGHICRGDKCWIIFNQNLKPVYIFPEDCLCSNACCEDLYQRRRIIKNDCGRSTYSFYDYFAVGAGTLHDTGVIPLRPRPEGKVQCYLDLGNLNEINRGFEESAKYNTGSGGWFSKDMTVENKALILSMVLFLYCRLDSESCSTNQNNQNQNDGNKRSWKYWDKKFWCVICVTVASVFVIISIIVCLIAAFAK